MIPADTVTRVADTVAMVVRLDSELHARLKAHAEANDRTMAAEVRRALIAHLDPWPSVEALREHIREQGGKLEIQEPPRDAQARPRRTFVEPNFKRSKP